MNKWNTPYCLAPKEIFWIKVLNKYIYLLCGLRINSTKKKNTFDKVFVMILDIETFIIIYEKEISYFEFFKIKIPVKSEHYFGYN